MAVSTATVEVVRLTAADLADCRHQLGALLTDAVDDGASIGFLAPLDAAEAAHWWLQFAPEVEAGRRLVWAARDGAGRTVGTVGLVLEGKANGRHRAEVVKLMVHRDARGRGLARRLLDTAERAAADADATLLLLDTRTGSAAERLYDSAGWTRYGLVPDYAADPDGTLSPATFFYKSLT
ncbi:GNAT family N-acetyltransferase [Kitasatospora paracochleata]|uniref:Ribosomal protein S18 acetylase RimI-like enzyme n=1 Tax=Kitasatospora paracochleata TaxID=58354 RepID=A0ABT1J866_9ACTN|nr:GNAT family N-acetyltransferase [Kitasatospora paracochleata]MCP2312926.1 ribosomal protein S18 acetylase RimI-like enzyme [Kitasatospora paracochleata]